MSDKTMLDRALDFAPALLSAAVAGFVVVLGTQFKTDRTAEDFARFQSEVRTTLAEIKADTKGLPVLSAQVLDLQAWRRDQLAYNGALDAKIADMRVTLGGLVSDVADFKSASRQRLAK